MRRHLLLLAAFLLMAQVHAQDIKVGLKGGYNRVSIHRVAQVNTLRPLEPLTPRHGYHVGLTTHIGLSEFFGIHVEPTFIRKGVLRGTIQEESLSYLEIPLLLSVNPWKQLKIEAGPAAGFLLAANIENGSDVRPKPVTNRREVSMIVGASWDFDDRLNFGTRYGRSLTTVSEMQFTTDSGFVTDEFEEYNQYVEVFVRLYLLGN